MVLEPKSKHARLLRKNSTDTEKKLWDILRSHQLDGYKFRRQHPIDCFIVDFACVEKKLIVEADGGQHHENAQDELRTQKLNNLGWQVLRFWNHEILENENGVARRIMEILSDNPPHPKHSAVLVEPTMLPPLPPQGRAERGLANEASSTEILERFRVGYGKDIDLTLRPAYRDLLAKLGNPHEKLPPVFHVAGTNGKGSTCAFLRAMLEAGGYRVHVYTSPHLVRFHERIRIAGELIEEQELTDILVECENLATPGGVSYFEVSTIAAFVAFARHPADFVILETGLGGRLDATNIVAQPLANLITRLSYDHRDYLGDDMAGIAREKAGIMRQGVPCFTAAQPQPEAMTALRDAAQKIGTPLSVGGEGWHVRETATGFHFTDATRNFDLPAPALLGAHQYLNAGLAIAALSVLPKPLSQTDIATGLRKVEWPARLQRLTNGALAKHLPTGTELWLDGGHNDSAGEVLAAQIETWRVQDGATPKPLVVILGMLTTKRVEEFLSPFAVHIAAITCIAIENEPLSYSADALVDEVGKLGLKASVAKTVTDAVTTAATQNNTRILICGSLYLAGIVLAL